MFSILITDSNSNIRKFLKHHFEQKNYDVFLAQNTDEAKKIIENHVIDFLILENDLANLSGLEFIKLLKENSQAPISILMSSEADIELAIQALRNGAYDFIIKPFTTDDLDKKLNDALEIVELKYERDSLKEQLKKSKKDDLIGQSFVMQKVLKLIEKVAVTDSTVLLQGETGTGKEVAAKLVHEKSSRKLFPFVAINCSAIAEPLLESELFGHEKGAFTDARQLKKGLFESADGGTIFLDEIGDMPLNLQAKILRVLQEKTFRRVGGNIDIKSDVRIISATHRNLVALIDKRQFREDLFYRLNVFPITMPPLRERESDVIILVTHFIKKFAVQYNKNLKLLTANAQDEIKKYPWPGNIRELKNIIERIMIINDDKYITEADFPFFKKELVSKSDLILKDFKSSKEDLINSFEKNYFIKLLTQFKGNVSKAAEFAKLDRTSLQRLLKEHHISSKQFNK